MGCSHGKCCRSYPESSDEVSGEFRDVGRFGFQGMHMLTERWIESIPVPLHDFQLDYSVLTQRGYYPDSPDKENQDSYCIRTQLQGNPNIHFFGVFDGHGLFGTEYSNFVKDRLVEKLDNDPTLVDDPTKAYNSAFQATNQELHESLIDDSMSGTTVITVLVVGDKLFVANVGDSRAVIATKVGNQVWRRTYRRIRLLSGEMSMRG
ncbi:hypothetical protein MLD38_027371 [Melastoma candidum]|uniref:Uncharacterized protein n=1 Tax=Melastoma candidum TaxID=119954 RepID=A0ACB9P1I9_9MYRT|nr:hypothetical protein MLD38_027371 [Melastoma candidum]